jgi:MFS family permease
MTTALLVGGAVGVALLSLPVAWLTIPSTILAFGSGWGWTGLLGLTVTRIFASTPGLSTALVITTAGGAGAAAGPAIASMLLGLAGYPLAWGFAAVCFLGSAIAVWHVNRLSVTNSGFGAHIRDGPPRIEPAAEPNLGTCRGLNQNCGCDREE